MQGQHMLFFSVEAAKIPKKLSWTSRNISFVLYRDPLGVKVMSVVQLTFALCRSLFNIY